MRRLLLVICCLFLLTSCTDGKYSEQITLYNHLVDETDSYNQSNISKSLPFDIGVYFEKMTDDEITYRVIIDNPKENIKKIKAIAIHNYKTTDIYPTSGVFEAPLNLMPDVVDMDEGKVKGIILVGYVNYNGEIESFKTTVKVLVEYYDNNDKLNKVYYEYHK